MLVIFNVLVLCPPAQEKPRFNSKKKSAIVNIFFLTVFPILYYLNSEGRCLSYFLFYKFDVSSTALSSALSVQF